MIVVGVDRSRGAKQALGWAVGEARLRRTSVRAIYAWRSPITGGRAYIPANLVDPDVLQASARDLVVADVDEVTRGAPAGVQVESVAIEGPAPQVLIDAAKDAELLVVGSRGLGGFTGLLLGSVSQQVAQHALCPVVIVPEDAVDTWRDVFIPSDSQ
jgi:nucleotide-binding universal stress UspA family protein